LTAGGAEILPRLPDLPPAASAPETDLVTLERP
jgi:hypothetical protein